MADLFLEWADDFQIDDTGDVLTVDGNDEVVQRIIRRFLTNASTIATVSGVVQNTPDYMFESGYGGNAPSYVNQLVNAELVATIQKNLMVQAAQEIEIDVTTTTITVSMDATGTLFVDAVIGTKNGGLIAIPQLEIAQ